MRMPAPFSTPCCRRSSRGATILHPVHPGLHVPVEGLEGFERSGKGQYGQLCHLVGASCERRLREAAPGPKDLAKRWGRNGAFAASREFSIGRLGWAQTLPRTRSAPLAVALAACVPVLQRPTRFGRACPARPSCAASGLTVWPSGHRSGTLLRCSITRVRCTIARAKGPFRRHDSTHPPLPQTVVKARDGIVEFPNLTCASVNYLVLLLQVGPKRTRGSGAVYA